MRNTQTGSIRGGGDPIRQGPAQGRMQGQRLGQMFCKFFFFTNSLIFV